MLESLRLVRMHAKQNRSSGEMMGIGTCAWHCTCISGKPVLQTARWQTHCSGQHTVAYVMDLNSASTMQEYYMYTLANIATSKR